MDNINIPTQSQFRIMVYMYPDRAICFADQQIYSQERWFHLEMEKLMKWGRIKKVNELNGAFDKHISKYKLTVFGGEFVERLLKYHEMNNHEQA